MAQMGSLGPVRKLGGELGDGLACDLSEVELADSDCVGPRAGLGCRMLRPPSFRLKVVEARCADELLGVGAR